MFQKKGSLKTGHCRLKQVAICLSSLSSDTGTTLTEQERKNNNKNDFVLPDGGGGGGAGGGREKKTKGPNWPNAQRRRNKMAETGPIITGPERNQGNSVHIAHSTTEKEQQN